MIISVDHCVAMCARLGRLPAQRSMFIYFDPCIDDRLKLLDICCYTHGPPECETRFMVGSGCARNAKILRGEFFQDL